MVFYLDLFRSDLSSVFLLICTPFQGYSSSLGLRVKQNVGPYYLLPSHPLSDFSVVLDLSLRLNRRD